MKEGERLENFDGLRQDLLMETGTEAMDPQFATLLL